MLTPLRTTNQLIKKLPVFHQTVQVSVAAKFFTAYHVRIRQWRSSSCAKIIVEVAGLGYLISSGSIYSAPIRKISM